MKYNLNDLEPINESPRMIDSPASKADEEFEDNKKASRPDKNIFRLNN